VSISEITRDAILKAIAEHDRGPGQFRTWDAISIEDGLAAMYSYPPGFAL
jgi:hypothetical protein